MRHLLFILFIGCISTASAQLSVGVRGGYGAHGVYFEAPANLNRFQEPFFKTNAGLVIVFNNVNNTGLQTEINLAEKGWMEVDTLTDTKNWWIRNHKDTLHQDPYFKKSIRYLEIPFYSHWEIGSGKVRPIIFAGPYLAFKLSEKTESWKFDVWWHDQNQYLQYEQEIKQIDFGIKLGLGLRYNINKHLGIYVDARYDLEVAGGRDIFIDRPNNIQASRLTEISGSFGILWHLIPQKKKKVVNGYKPKEDLYEEF